MRVQLVFAVLSALLLAACSPRAATDITSFVDPSHRKPPFTSVVVACYDATLDEQMIIETEAAKQFAALGVRAFRRMDVVPPTSTLPPEEKAQKLVGTGAAAIVVIRPAGVDIVDTYIPPSYTPPGRYTPGSYSPGYIRSRPIAVYQLSVIDLWTGQQVWKAEAGSRGNSIATFDDLSRNLAETAVRRLVEDGLF